MTIRRAAGSYGLAFLPLLLAIVIAALVALFCLRNWRSYENLRNEAIGYEEIVRRSNSLLSSVKDAETGQRGYLLTGKDSYLVPYRIAASVIEVDIEALARSSKSSDQARIDQLHVATQQKMQELRETIDLRKSGGVLAALSVVETDRGKNLMDQIRNEIVALLRDEEKRRDQAQRELESSATSLRWLSILGSLTLIVLLSFAHVAFVESQR